MLGEIRLRSADGTELDALLRQPKRLALLAYLASPTPGTWHRRDILLALFWPELDMSHARTSLRNALYVLRQILGEETIRNRGDEELAVDAQYISTDVAAVWDALKNGRPDDALAKYGGDLLPGLFPSDSEGFQRWLASERLRLKVAVSSSAVERINELEREGKLKEAITIARRVTEIQPEDETIVRRVMSLYGAMGDRAGALAAFESYRARLSTDFDAEPAAETIALATTLRAAAEIAPSRQPASRPSTQTPVQAEPIAEHSPHIYPPRRSTRNWPAIAALVAVVAIGGIVASKMFSRETSISIARSMPLTVEEGLQVEAAISPNGRLVAYAKGNASRLRIFVQRIGGGAAWPMSPDSTEIQLMPRWSPDNDEILFLARNNAYASPSLGGAPRLIARGSDGDGMIRSAVWSPSGDSVAIVRHDSLLVTPVEGNATRFVGNGYQLHSCVWSPDGKSIACVSGNLIAFTPGPLFGNEAQSAILLFPANGGTPIDLTGNAYEYKSPAWSTDGKTLWMLSNRDGVSGEAYAIHIGADGHAEGQPTRVGFNAEWISLSSGRVAYSVPIRKSNIWSIPIPRDTALKFSAAAKQMTSGNQVIELMSASRDGKWLIYDSDRRGNADIYRIPTNGGAEERLTLDAAPEYAADLSPNGQELAWHKWLKGARRVFIKRLDNDREHELTAVTGDVGVPRWSPDGNSILAWSHTKESGGVFLVRRDANGGWTKPVWRLDEGQLPVWSPDGQMVAFVLLDGSVRTMPADSGAVTAVYTPRKNSKTDPIATYLSWRGDGQTIWFLGEDALGHAGFWSVSLGGKRPGRPRLLVKLDTPAGTNYGPAFTSDGSRFFFTVNERLSNVRWAELARR